MSYTWSGTSGAGIITSAEGVASFGGHMEGYLVAKDTYVDPQVPLAWLARFYGANVDAQNITVMSGGTLYANNGTYTNLDIGPGGSASLSSSHIAGATVSGYFASSGAAIKSATLLLNGKITGENLTIYSGAKLTLSRNAVVNNVTLSGNKIKWYGADWAMALLEVSSGGVVNGGEGFDACRAIIRSGGTAIGMEFHTSTHFYVMAKGLISGGAVHCANLEVRGGTVRGTTVNSGGLLKFERVASGQAISVTIGSKGSAYIGSGGTMTDTLVSGHDGGSGVVIASSGVALRTTVMSLGTMSLRTNNAYVTSTTLSKGGNLILSNGGLALSTTISSGGLAIVSGGVLSDTEIFDGGRASVYKGAAASGATLYEDGKLILYSGGSADAVTVNANGYLYLYSGASGASMARATNIIENGGFAWGQTGTTLTFLANAFSDVDLHSNATLHSVTTGTNIKITGSANTIMSAIAFGGSMYNVEAFSGGVIFVNSGHVSGATVHSGGYLNLAGNNTKTFVSGAFIESGASMTMKGGSVQNVTISGAAVGAGATTEDTPIEGAAHLDVYNGTLDSLTVAGVGGFYGSSNAHDDVNKRITAVISGGTVNSVTIADAGYVVVSGATVNDVTLSKGGISAWCYVDSKGTLVSSSMHTRLYVYNGGLATNVKTTGTGLCEVFVRGGTVSGVDINSKGFFGVYAGALLKDGIASGKGASLQGRGGMISGVTLISSADMFMSTGTIRGNNFLSGAYLRLGSAGANAVADSTFISGGYGEIYVSSGKQKYTSGFCNAYVSSGGKLTNSLVGDGAYVLVRSNGVVSNTALLGLNSYDANTQDASLMARLHISGGALWQGGDVLKHAQVLVYSGGSAEGITMGSGAHVYISANATATDMVVDGALDFALRGGTAENTAVLRGSMLVSNGGVASGTIVRGGTLRLLNAAAVASDTVLSGGVILCNANGGTFENTTVSKGGFISGVFGTYNGVTVSSGGSVRIYASGGTVVNDLVVEAGANVVLDCVRVTGGGAFNIASLAGVNEKVSVVNYTVDKSYTLAETGNANLKLNMAYQGIYNEFGAGETYLSPIYDGRAFTLDAEGKTLTIATHNMSGTILTTEAADLATSGAFLTGYVNSDDKALMWADVQLGSAVTFATSAAGIAGDAWIDLDRTQAAGGTIYGAEGDCMSDGKIRYLVHGAGSVGNFAGGATAGGVVGGVELVGFNNTYGQTYLGGMGTVAGLVSARVSSGNTLAKDFYAGALANYAKTSQTTSVGGIDTQIALNTSAGTAKEVKSYAKGNIYGASQVKAGTVTTAATVHSVGDVVLTISNGETTKGTQMCIFAAGYATGHDEAKTLPVYTVDSVTATIAGGNWGEACGGRGVFGGAFAGDNTTAGNAGVWAEVGAVNLTVSGGTMGNVYGGGWAQKGAKSEVGAVNLTISGGTIANVFGGGAHSNSGGSTVAGDVTITVKGGTISGAIYARGQAANDTTGSASVIFSGSKAYSCDVYGYSYIGGAAGGATLSYNGYTGTFSGSIGGFDSVTLAGATDMTIALGEGETVSNTAWIFDVSERFTALAKTTALDWSDADFTGSTIAINLASGSTTEWDLVSAATNTNYNKFDVLVGGASILSETIDLDQEIASGDYQGWGFTNEEGVLKFKHLA